MENGHPGKMLQYHLSEKIGSCFAGDVYHAWDSGLDRNVAVRIIRPELSQNTAFRSQLMTSALASRELVHPNVARLYAVEEVESKLIVVSEHIQGQTIKSLVSQKPLELSAFLKLARQLAHGLKAIHQLSIAHKYVTSDNVIITDQGDAKLVDLGVAPTSKMVSNGTNLIAPEKLTYFSPEFLLGNESTALSDQYSLGVVLFEAVTSNLPFEEDSREKLIKIIENPAALARPFEDIRHGDIYLLITRLMSKLPEDRFVNADELIASISEIDITQKESRKDANSHSEGPIKSRLYLMTSMAFLLLVLLWLIVKGLGN